MLLVALLVVADSVDDDMEEESTPVVVVLDCGLRVDLMLSIRRVGDAADFDADDDDEAVLLASFVDAGGDITPPPITDATFVRSAKEFSLVVMPTLSVSSLSTPPKGPSSS